MNKTVTVTEDNVEDVTPTTIQDLMVHALQGDTVALKPAFDDVMIDRVSDAINTARLAAADELFGQNKVEDEEVEETEDDAVAVKEPEVEEPEVEEVD